MLEFSCFLHFYKSGQQDLNLRPLGPQPSALPSYAIPRKHYYYNRKEEKINYKF